jgi:hypothetical protein
MTKKNFFAQKPSYMSSQIKPNRELYKHLISTFSPFLGGLADPIRIQVRKTGLVKNGCLVDRHMKEHMEVPLDTSNMSEQELQFHYFKVSFLLLLFIFRFVTESLQCIRLSSGTSNKLQFSSLKCRS